MNAGKLEQGFNQARFQMIVRSLIFIFHENEVLLIKGAANKKIWPNLYNGIGGHLEKGEDVLASAQRELFEETGLDHIPLTLRGNIVIEIDEKQGILLFIYRGESSSKRIRNSEEGDLHWIDINKFDTLKLVPDLRIILPKIIDGDGGYFSGYYHYVDTKLEMRFSGN